MSQPVVVDQFGGLQLPSDPEEIGFGQALDFNNLDLDRRRSEEHTSELQSH